MKDNIMSEAERQYLKTKASFEKQWRNITISIIAWSVSLAFCVWAVMDNGL